MMLDVLTTCKLVMIAVVFLAAGVCHAAPVKSYDCHRACGPIKIDGKLDDEAWQKAKTISFVLPKPDAEPLSKPEAKVLWDDGYLFVSYCAYDKDIWSILTVRDSTTFQEDCLECFIMPDIVAKAYYNFEINELCTVYDAFSLSRFAGGSDCHRWHAWNCEGLRVGIDIDGTINNPNDIDKCWRMEIAIPFAQLPSLDGKKPKVGDEWEFILARYDYSIYLPEGVELSTCSSLQKVDFHEHSQWSTLKFAE